MKHVSRILVLIGFLLIFISGLLYLQRTSPSRLSFSYNDQILKQSVGGNIIPIHLQIKSVDINLPIIPAHVSKTSWETTDNGVSYLVTSPVPGSIGNSILYGHNWTSLLGRLSTVKTGDVIEIFFSDYSKKQFTIIYTVTVSPADTYVLQNTKDTRITLYTCTGFLDSKRFVVVAELQ